MLNLTIFRKTGPCTLFFCALISIGLITSLCLPLVNSGSLAGVTCTDILLDELFSDFTNFQQGELSYAFMIDGQGRVMVHYLQPTPKAITDDPDPIDIYTLETNPAAKPMIESMKRCNIFFYSDTQNIMVKIHKRNIHEALFHFNVIYYTFH